MRIAATVALLVVAMAACAGAWAADPPTRDEYVAQLEAVCKPRAEATERAMNGVRGDVKAERFTAAGAKFAKAAAIFGGTVKGIAAAPQPPGDAAKLSQWITELNQQERFLKAITGQLRANHAVAAQRLAARFIHSGNVANNTVLAFGFNYCSFKFSRYG